MDNNNDEFIYEDKQPEEPEIRSRAVSPSRGFYWLERGLSDVVIPHFGKWFAAGIVYSAAMMSADVTPNSWASPNHLITGIFSQWYFGRYVRI